MSAAEQVLDHPVEERPKTNEERILAFVNDRPDGCSSFAAAIETRIPRSVVEFVLEKLERKGAVQGTRNKKGVITWYPVGGMDAKPVPEPPAPPELPEPAPNVEEDDEGPAEPIEEKQLPKAPAICRPENDCPFCGAHNISSEVLEKHKLHCPENPDRILRREVRDKEGTKPAKGSAACKHCGKVMEAGKCRRHEPVCGSNPERNGRKNPPKEKVRREEAERIDCPIEGCKSRPIREKQNVRSHLNSYHRLPLVEVRAYLDKMFPKPAGESTDAQVDHDPEPEASETVASLLGSVCNDRSCPVADLDKPEESIQKTPSGEPQKAEPAVMDNEPKEEQDICSAGPEPEPSPFICDNCGAVLITELEGKLYCPNRDCVRGPGPESEPAPTGDHQPAGLHYLGDAETEEEAMAMIDAHESGNLQAGPARSMERPVKVVGVTQDGWLEHEYAGPLAHGGVVSAPTLGVIGEGDCSGVPMPAAAKFLNVNLHVADPEKISAAIGRALRKSSGGDRATGPRPTSLEEFAELHRRRLRKDIRTMRRAEKRMVRRAACLMSMSERVREARMIKERELRRFDRELAEVSGR